MNDEHAPTPNQPADAELWQRVRGGDDAAFGQLFERHCDAVYTFAGRRLGDWTEAEDVVSAVFLEAWRQREKVRPLDGSLRPWLFGVARNVVGNRLRSTQRRRRALSRTASEAPEPDFALEVDDRVDGARRAANVRTRLAGLPDSHREVLLLWAWEGLSYAQIAVALDLPMGTVRSRLSRARRAFTQEPATRVVTEDSPPATPEIENAC